LRSLLAGPKDERFHREKVLHVSRWGRRNSTRHFNMKVELDISKALLYK
ncbi:Uncharacterized protein APZ42_009603, partial [Daphnia magna]